MIKLTNFFKDCPKCGRPLRLDYTEQTRICPNCKTEVRLAENERRFVERRALDNRKSAQA